ncbi:hypothetical protein B7494_g7776 [Chlorociboria aeruginascens]|nr:hypothetical protein B7494_g7776 [Chlorociboria aeruginascens]
MLYPVADFPEVNALPKGWVFKVTKDERRVYFIKDNGETSFNHPYFGGLPKPWILMFDTGKLREVYYNRVTKQKTREDPRYMMETLASQGSQVRKDLQQAVSMVRAGKDSQLGGRKHTEILDFNNRDQFEIVHTIDDGSGQIGGMNGGIFVVRVKGLENRLFVEKRFKSEARDFELAKKEIKMLQRLTHPSLTAYFTAFITPDPPCASLYVEFCDRGSLDNLVDKFSARGVRVPEPFVWHIFSGLCDGLDYLITGRLGKNSQPDLNWSPVIHRDIKPDNILMKSRSTIASTKYFYVVLSDFGLACDEFGDDRWQKARVTLGTSLYWAPELLKDLNDKSSTFPGQFKHSRYTDLWALGAMIFNLCVAEGQCGHLRSAPKGIDASKWSGTKGSLIDPMDIKDLNFYTPQLREAILLATTKDHMWERGVLKDMGTIGNRWACTGLAQGAPAETTHLTPRLNNGVGVTPALGFNNWNSGLSSSAATALAAANAFVGLGLKDAGYEYINTDDTWSSSARVNGTLVPDPTKWPNGVKAVADEIHALGLKIGLYGDSGTATCSGFPGSQGYETTDANTLASWGVDFWKYDNCNTPTAGTSQTRYTTMRDALLASGRPIYYAICNWGADSVYTWGQSTGNSWRVSSDVTDAWSAIVDIASSNQALAPYAGPGGFNDFDMLEVGNGGLTTEEERAHFGLWAIGKSPLLIGTDLSKISNASLAVLLNADVIAINQDPLGTPASYFQPTGASAPVSNSLYPYWSGPLSEGYVIGLVASSGPATLSVNFSDVPGLGSGTYSWKECYTGATGTGTSISATLQAHDMAIFRVLKIGETIRPMEWATEPP